MAAAVVDPMSSAWSTTPRTVATTTAITRASSPRTTRPAARLGLRLWRCRVPTSGLNTTARTAAKVIGNTISLTAASAVNTMIAASTNPTKLHDHTPNRGIRPSSPGAALGALRSESPLRSVDGGMRHRLLRLTAVTAMIGAGRSAVLTPNV